MTQSFACVGWIFRDTLPSSELEAGFQPRMDPAVPVSPARTSPALNPRSPGSSSTSSLMQITHLACIRSATPISPLHRSLSTTRQLSRLKPRAHCLTTRLFSAYRAQQRRPTDTLGYNGTRFHSRNSSRNSKSPLAATMSETVIREVATDVWIFSK